MDAPWVANLKVRILAVALNAPNDNNQPGKVSTILKPSRAGKYQNESIYLLYQNQL